MNIKRILFIGFEVIVVFTVVWLLVQLPEMKQNANLNRNIGLHYEWYGFLNDHFWQDISLLILAFVSGSTGIQSGDNGKLFFVDSSSAAISLQLPSPASNFNFKVKDIKGTFSTNNVTLVRSASEKIEVLASDYILQSDFGSYSIYCDGTDWYLL